ncbi:MAG: NepR family anti-sigma factor [Sphingomonas paucimobilis]
MKDGEQAARQSSGKKAVTPSSDKKDSSSLGNALRAVYQDAAGEAVPDEMLDLLSKLK